MAFFLFLIIVAIALGIIGFVVKGLFYLFLIGIAVLVIDIAYGAWRFRRGGGRHRLMR
ncbi:hypothetical protein [Streptomyces sp. ODS28]|uniref:hypothetical protein n=1 Tax=Streptomyces sp. ODS28 TaxID=3136688 RepID=UPI0031E85604